MKIAPTPAGIASKLKKLLNITNPVVKNEINVLIDSIHDPEGFIKKIHSAYAVRRFTAHFTGPNPLDADELFQKPISVYCQAVNGEKGKIEVEGESLNDEVVVSVAHSTAATGNAASAKILEKKGQPQIKINFDGDPVKRTFDSDEHDFKVVIIEMREEYARVRGI